ncbi:MAG: 4Fe-4S binding protein [Candidatus Gastranaerophilaceae bacterium]
MFAYNYKALDESTRADKCIDCKLCIKNCPQNLDIPELLKVVQKEVENVEKELAK